jgi:hypothetical protein
LNIALAVTFAYAAAAALGDDAGFTRLSGPQIRTKFSGMRLTDEVHWSEVYEANGVLVSTSMGRKGAGTWRIDGSELCTEMEKGEDLNCYEVWLSGNSVQLRIAGSAGVPLDAVLQKNRSSL